MYILRWTKTARQATAAATATTTTTTTTTIIMLTQGSTVPF